MAQPTMSDWRDSLSAHVLTVLHANPTDEITAKFTKAFKQRFPDADLNDLSIYERLTASVTCDDGEKISYLFLYEVRAMLTPTFRLQESDLWFSGRFGVFTRGLSNRHWGSQQSGGRYLELSDDVGHELEPFSRPVLLGSVVEDGCDWCQLNHCLADALRHILSGAKLSLYLSCDGKFQHSRPNACL